MLACHLFILKVLIVATTIYISAGVQIKSIGLKSGKPFVYNLLTATIQFDAVLEEAETIQNVTWVLGDGVGLYEWTPDEPPQVSGILEGAVNTSAENGQLTILSAEIKHAGIYTLTLTSNLGTDNGTYNLLVYYMGGFQLSDLSPSPQKPSCICITKLVISRLAPYPNISLWAENKKTKPPTFISLSKVAKVKENVTIYNDGSYGYEMTAEVPILEIPLESFLAWYFWIYDSKLQVFGTKSSSVSGKTCPEPEAIDKLNYTRVSGEESCRGGYTEFTNMDYFCANADNPKLEPKKTMQCNKNGTWIETDEKPWPVCEENTGGNKGTSQLGNPEVHCCPHHGRA
ncbi:uncharacterized protein [Periplaneta americana]|uniref:uncharacterized protein isoform X2 n=1 Tax=Periplaneta americana TaxID=6978 RepID=UPI0037E9788E